MRIYVDTHNFEDKNISGFDNRNISDLGWTNILID
jgi:hypothetical protein